MAISNTTGRFLLGAFVWLELAVRWLESFSKSWCILCSLTSYKVPQEGSSRLNYSSAQNLEKSPLISNNGFSFVVDIVDGLW